MAKLCTRSARAQNQHVSKTGATTVENNETAANNMMRGVGLGKGGASSGEMKN
jgi:hypothetical protein